MKLFLVILFSSYFVLAQSENRIPERALQLDYQQYKAVKLEETKFDFQFQDKKSPAIAGLLSLFFPGAGEFYSGNYLKAGIFAGIEIAVVSVALIYDKKGDDQTTAFQKVADARWSVVKYAEWLNRFKGTNIPIDPNTALKPWERVNWDSLNRAESIFSHRLPSYGEQQYYELIGKYHQYTAGWDSFDPNNADNSDLPPIFTEYAQMRGKANDYYNMSAKAVMGIYINHFLSTLDGIWTAISYNRDLQVSLRIDESTYAYRNIFIPRINTRYYF